MTQSYGAVISGGGDAGLQDFLRIVWNWTRLDEGRDCYRRLIGDVPECHKFTSQLDELYEQFAAKKEDLEYRRIMKLDEHNLPPAELIKYNKEKFAYLDGFFHVQVRRRVDALLPQVNRAVCGEFDSNGKLVVLRTPAEGFRGCNAHNHFFALLTLSCLPRRTTHRSCSLDEFAIYHGVQPKDTSSYSEYIDGGLGGNIEVFGVGRTDVLLIRHGVEMARL
jgi:hypothetical protein